MKKLIKSKVFISIMITLAMVLTAFSGIILLVNRNKDKEIIAADTAIKSPMVARKIWSNENNDGSYTLQHGEDNLVFLDDDNTLENRQYVMQSSLKEELKNNEFVILNKRTVEIENNLQNQKEIILVSFNVANFEYENSKLVAHAGTESTSYYTLQVNAYLNNKPLKTNEDIKDQGVNDSKYYFQLLNLNENATDSEALYYSDGTKVPQSELEGKYKFVFQYSTKESDGTVGSQETSSMEFYVFNEDTYKNTTVNEDGNAISEENIAKLEPRLSNTEKINRLMMNNNQSGGVQYNYFNFNNEATKNYFDKNEKGTSLLFPTINYDITKYSLRYKVSLYGSYSVYEYIFAGYNKDSNPIVEVYKDGNKLSSVASTKDNTTTISVGDQSLNDFTINNNIISIKLSNIGEYDFEFNYVYETKEYNKTTNKFSTTGYVINSQESSSYTDENISFVKKENWDMVGNSKLYIFGYQLFYSNYSTTSVSGNLEFTNGKDKVTDVTFINSADKFDSNIEIGNNSSNLNISRICSTNQAPITLSYYAKMTLTNNTTNSYYKYWSSVDSYEKSSTQPEDIQKITNNTRFTKNGYYQVFIEYQFENYKYVNNETLTNGNETKKYQFFSFAINNSEPKITVVENTQDEKAILTDGYTNKDVKITWSANTEFDILPRVSILKKGYGENDTYSTIYDQEKNIMGTQYGIIANSDGKQITISTSGNINTNGKYQVVIHYGPGSHTLVKYRFTIDNEKIDGITTHSIYSAKDKVILEDKIDSNIINTSFALDWNEKNSGAEITAHYDFIALENGTINNELLLSELLGNTKEDKTVAKIIDRISKNYTNRLNDNKELDPRDINLYNGYILGSISSNIPYTKPTFEYKYDTKDKTKIIETTIKDINSMRTSAGFYLFTLTDSAGNISYKSVFVDNSQPVIYTFTNEEENFVLNRDNVRKTASRDTIAIWGNNKAITIQDDAFAKLNDFILNEKQSNETLYNIEQNSKTLLIKNNEATIETSKIKDIHTANISQTFNIKATDLDSPKWYEGDHVHNVSVSDESLINTNQTSQVFNNTAKLNLEMNSDNSLLMAYLAPSQDEIANNNRLDNASVNSAVSNGQQLFLEWIQNEGNDFEVQEITYYFFPLAFDSTSPIYPYSATPELTKNIDIASSTTSKLNSNKKISTAINIESNSTLEGLYIVKRAYKNDLVSADNISGDYSPRYYSFFIDRNKVISYAPNGTLIGNSIGLKIGSNSIANYQVIYQGEDFLVDTNENNSKFITSKLPILFLKDVNTLDKFDSNSIISEANKSATVKLDNIDTKLLIAEQIIDTFTLYKPDIYYKEKVNDKFELTTSLDVNKQNFKQNGYYKVVLHDKTLNLNTENDFTFIFQVKVETPSANIVQFTNNDATGLNEFLYYSENEQNISTNNRNMLVVWNKPLSTRGFDAEIDRNNFSIDGTLENGNKFKLIVNDGNLTATGVRLNKDASISIQTIDPSNTSFDNPTWDYYIDFNQIFSVLPKNYASTSAKYEINLHYVGQDEYLNYAETTKTIVFDFKKPEYNYNRLLESDIYLANYYNEQTYNEFINKFNDYTNEINFENYAFTVTKSFTLNEMVVSSDNIWSSANMDTYRMFIRKYNKYANESIENQQSIMPDDVRFNDIASFPNRYRFNENYKIDGKNIYTEISSFYWSNGDHKDYTLDYLLDNIDIDKELNSYYEIIEMDYAGNYRVYTIYLKDDSDTMKSNFITRDEAGDNENSSTKSFNYKPSYEIGENNEVQLINGSDNLNSILTSNDWEKLFSCQLELTQLFNEIDNKQSFNEQYIIATVADISKNKTTTLYYAPNENLDEFIANINALVSEYNYDSGNTYYITFTTSTGEYLKVEHRKPSKDYPRYTITNGPIGFDIDFNVSINDINLSSYFTNFEVYKAENGVLGTSPLERDSNNKEIIIEIEKYLINQQQDNASFRYSFKMQGNSGSEYLIVFTDNFGRQLKIRQVIGVEDNKDKVIYTANDYELITTDAYESTDMLHPVKLTYTNNTTTLKYQSILNTLSVYRVTTNTVDGKLVLSQGEAINITDGIIKTVNGICTYTLINQETNNNTIYKVVFTSTQGDEIYYIGYYNLIDKISIIRVSDKLKTDVSNQQTYAFDKMVYIQIENINPLFTTQITGKRQYLDENGNTKVEELGVIADGQTFSNLGNYTFTAKNNLGTTMVFFVNIEERSSGEYSVVYKLDGIEAGQLSPIPQDKSNTYAYGSMNNPYTFFTIYEYELKTNLAGQVKSEITSTTPIIVNGQTVGTSVLYKVYKLAIRENDNGETETYEKDVKYVSVTRLVSNSNFIRTNDNIFYINNIIQTGIQARISQDAEGNTKSAILSLEKTFNLVEGNNIILGYSFNGNFIKEINLGSASNEDLTFHDSGEYQFYFRDLAGNKQKFGNLDYFTMVLINDVIFTVNAKQSVDNSVFNESVSITLQNLEEFKDRRVTLKAKLNGKEIQVSRNRNTYIFNDYGVYNLTFEGQVVDEKGIVSNLTTTFNFRIININEAMATYEYVGLNNYEITKVVKYDTKDSAPQDITNLIRQELGVNYINTLALSTYENGLGGAGIYEITVYATYYSNKPNQQFTFKVWLNNDTDILIKSSIPFGSSTTKAITITLNKNQIFSKVGECKIMLNDEVWLEINETTASQNIAETYTINQNGVFNVRLVTNSGNTLESFIITKKEPLNAVAIVVIVISVIAVTVVAIIFIKLRKNMKVK